MVKVRLAAWGTAWLGMMASAGSAWAAPTTVKVAVAADARVEEQKPNSNLGKSYLATRGNSSLKGKGKAIESLLRFNVQGVSGIVTHATLRLWASTGTLNGPAVYPTSTGWSETGVTWSNRPSASGAEAANAGWFFGGQWIEWNVTSLIQGDGVVAFKLAQPDSTDTATFQSREQSHVPELLVTFDSNACAGQADGVACTDNSACTQGDSCQANACVPGPALGCDDANPCTTDACDPTTGCTHVASTGSCEADANACTVDTCQLGQCTAGAAKSCDDGEVCTQDACDPALGCTHAAVVGACEADGSPCTVDTCANGKCLLGASTVDCNDANPCTDDSCVALGCVHANNTAGCDADADACTVDLCSAGQCAPGATMNCDDGNVCTLDACSAGTCTHAAGGGTCDADGNPCTVDICQAGACAFMPPKNCDDGDACTADTCDAKTGNCVATATGAPECLPPTYYISKGATWRYRDSGIDPGATWIQPTYVDTSWSQGNAVLGYGVAGVATTVGFGPDPANKYPTTWFRTTFALSGVPMQPLALSVGRDDGVVIYVNGYEIFRSNMPAGAIKATTWASAVSTDGGYLVGDVPPSVLHVGTNVITAEVHQAAASSSDLAFDLQLVSGPVCVPSQTVETACDGVDNDCDGLTDWLLPIAENACSTAKVGNCAKGFKTCLAGGATCIAPPPVAEARNGQDDDCNGLIDDAADGVSSMQGVRVAVPTYMWTDTPGLVDAVLELCAHVGLPATGPSGPAQSNDWYDMFTQLDQHAVLFIPGYLIDEVMSPWMFTYLQTYAESGGIIVLGKPVGANIQAFAGISTVAPHSDIEHIAVDATVPATLWLDSAEERDLLVAVDPSKNPISVHTYTLDPSRGAQSFGTAMIGKQAVGAVFVRRQVGKGAIYSLGFDPLMFTDPHCYVNCFEPGKDVLAMLLKGILREATQGHYVLKHTAPGPQSGVVALTHDIDAPDAYTTGTWGKPGAPRMALMEQAQGVVASYMITSDYFTGYWVPSIIGQLLTAGADVAGGHTIQHLDMRSLPLGDCTVTKATYDPNTPTLCGEIRVNKEVVDAQLPAGKPLRAFRAPYLAVHDNQFDVLAAQGMLYDASFAVGDTRTNFPVSTVREPSLQFKFNHKPLITFPMTQEDGLGAVVDSQSTRAELQVTNQAQFLSRWKYALLHNSANNAWSVLLVHPSYGVGVNTDNLAVKIESVSKYIDFVKTRDVFVGGLNALGDFWRGRDAVTVQASYAPTTGYSGTLVTGTVAAPGFTLEFGDTVKTFSCPGGGSFSVKNNRVTFTELPASTTLSFQAGVL